MTKTEITLTDEKGEPFVITGLTKKEKEISCSGICDSMRMLRINIDILSSYLKCFILENLYEDDVEIELSQTENKIDGYNAIVANGFYTINEVLEYIAYWLDRCILSHDREKCFKIGFCDTNTQKPIKTQENALCEKIENLKR